MTPDISTTYAPGSSTITTQPVVGSGSPLSGGLGSLLSLLLQKRLAAAAAPRTDPRDMPYSVPVPEGDPREDARLARVNAAGAAARAATGPTEMEWRGAATRPIGQGAQMIPGMAVDPNLLPSQYRPQSAGVSYAPSVQYGARSAAADEDAYGAAMDADRARTRGTGDVGAPAAVAAPDSRQPSGAAPTVPVGTAPMLTPSNAVVQSQPKLTDDEQKRQLRKQMILNMQNMQHGGF